MIKITREIANQKVADSDCSFIKEKEQVICNYVDTTIGTCASLGYHEVIFMAHIQYGLVMICNNIVDYHTAISDDTDHLRDIINQLFNFLYKELCTNRFNVSYIKFDDNPQESYMRVSW